MIIIFGANGHIGRVAKQQLSIQAKFLNRSDCDINDHNSVRRIIDDNDVTHVINLAAMTNLEACEEQKALALNTNTMAAVNMAEICKQYQKKFIQLSSGCVFDGGKVHQESDRQTPAVWYTHTKVFAEQYISKFDDALIIRPRQLLSTIHCRTNLITKILQCNEYDAITELNSVTFVSDVISFIEHAIANKIVGLYHIACAVPTTPYDIATAIRATLKPSLSVRMIEYDELLKRLPNRRVNTVLDISKSLKAGFKPLDFNIGLQALLKNYGISNE